MKQDSRRPVKSSVPAASIRPKAGPVPDRKKWSFSFQHWQQINYFGVDQCPNSWFVSLLQRMHDLSKVDVEEFEFSHELKRSYRYHPIDWFSVNIPIQRSDIYWLGEISESPDFELFQFQISKALGRVVGFFDERKIFQVVLLDPMHNIQPSIHFDYRVQATHISQCQVSSLTVRFENAVLRSNDLSSEQKEFLLGEIRNQYSEYSGGALILNVKDEQLQKIYSLALTGVLVSLGDVIDLAIDQLST